MKRAREEYAPSKEQLESEPTRYAQAFIAQVKERFADKVEVFDTFLEVLKQCRADPAGQKDVVRERVKALFQYHPDLVLGFNTFLPKADAIQLDEIPRAVRSFQSPS